MRLGHHRRRIPAPTAAGRARQRGAVVLEMAIVATFLLTLVGGAFDYGMAWRSTLAMNEGVRGGARVGSGIGKDVSADVTILTSLQSTLASSGMLNRVDRVVIFSAKDTNGIPSTACINGTSGTCNTFTGDQFRAVTTGSAKGATGCITNSTRSGWCPTNRNDVQLTAQYVGVWVRARHDYLFPVLGTGITITRSAAMRIEP